MNQNFVTFFWTESLSSLLEVVKVILNYLETVSKKSWSILKKLASFVALKLLIWRNGRVEGVKGCNTKLVSAEEVEVELGNPTCTCEVNRWLD